MDPITDLTMAINSTYSAILSQIQLSNLNFSIKMTPFAAYITLKKSVQKDLHGVPSSPSPPVLFLLQQIQEEHRALQAENYKLKVSYEMLKNKFNTNVNENVCLRKEVEDKNSFVDVLEANNEELNHRIDSIEKEHSKDCAAKASAEFKIKEMRKKHTEEVHELQDQISKLKKILKAKDKVDKDLSNARETIKALKAEKSLLKTCKTKLEGETRKLEKRIKNISRAKNTFNDKGDTNEHDSESILKNVDINENYTTLSFPTSVPAYPSSFPSSVANWNPVLDRIPQEPHSIPSMISHFIFSPQPSEVAEKLVSKEEFLEMWAEHRKQMKKDWAEILSKINNLVI